MAWTFIILTFTFLTIEAHSSCLKTFNVSTPPDTETEPGIKEDQPDFLPYKEWRPEQQPDEDIDSPPTSPTESPAEPEPEIEEQPNQVPELPEKEGEPEIEVEPGIEEQPNQVPDAPKEVEGDESEIELEPDQKPHTPEKEKHENDTIPDETPKPERRGMRLPNLSPGVKRELTPYPAPTPQPICPPCPPSFPF